MDNFVHSCKLCQLRKVFRGEAHPPWGQVRAADLDAVWSIDLCGPFPPTRAGHKYVVVVINNTTRFPWAYPVKDATAEAIVELEGFVEHI